MNVFNHLRGFSYSEGSNKHFFNGSLEVTGCLFENETKLSFVVAT